MKVKITRPTIAQKRQVFPGDLLEVSKDEAAQLIGAGKAVAVKDAAVETATLPTEAVESSAQAEMPVEESSAPKRKTKKASE